MLFTETKGILPRWFVPLVLLVFAVGVAGAEAPAPSAGAVREYEQGRTSFGESRYADAADHFEKAARLAPSASLYAQWLGRAYGLQAERAGLLSKAGLAVRARDSLARAVTLDPDNISARSDLAAYYAAAPGFMGGGMSKAQLQVAEIRKRDPYMGRVRAGDLLWDDKHPAEAEREYLAAVGIDPKRPDARGRLGSYYAERGKYPQAFAQWDAVLAATPAEPHALYGLGKTAALSGQRTGEGEAALREFLKEPKPVVDGPPPARAHYYLGTLLTKKGDTSGARAEYKEALRLNPNLLDAKQALGKLPP